MTNRRNNFGIQCKNKKQRDQKSASSAGRALHIRKSVCAGHEAWPPRGGEPCNRILLAPLIFSGARIPGFPIGNSL